MLSEEIFKKHIDLVEFAYATTTVEPKKIKAGDIAYNWETVEDVEINATVRAERDGWQIYVEDKAKFLTDEEYASNVVTIEVTPIKSVPDDANIQIVHKGQTIAIQPWSETAMGIEKSADEDGVVLTLNEKRKFRSWTAFVSEFRTEGHPIASQIPEQFKAPIQYRYIADKTPVPYLILPEDTVIDFKEGPCASVKGEVLYQNPNDADDFTSTSRRVFDRHFIPANEENRKGHKLNPAFYLHKCDRF